MSHPCTRSRKRTRSIRLDIVLLPNDVASDFEPQLFAKDVVVLGLVGVHLGELEIIVLERQVDAGFVQSHLRVDEYARLHSLVRPTQSQRVVEVVVRVAGGRVVGTNGEEVEEVGLVGGRVGGKEGEQGVVDRGICVLELEDRVLEVFDDVL
jgi:hypothetical protein